MATCSLSSELARKKFLLRSCTDPDKGNTRIARWGNR